VRWSVTPDADADAGAVASTWTTPWRAAKPEPRMIFWRSFLAVDESFLDLCRRLVVDTQEPMAAADDHQFTTTTAPTPQLVRKKSQGAPCRVSTELGNGYILTPL
jgi:hypothetical protein